MAKFEVTYRDTPQVDMIEAAYFIDPASEYGNVGAGYGAWIDFLGDPVGPRGPGPVVARLSASAVRSVRRLDGAAPTAASPVAAPV